jgi:hypothetical protein
MNTNIQTHPRDKADGTVLIVMNDGVVEEVISDLQLDVQVMEADGTGYRSYPSRPLWEFLREATRKLLRTGYQPPTVEYLTGCGMDACEAEKAVRLIREYRRNPPLTSARPVTTPPR